MPAAQTTTELLKARVPDLGFVTALPVKTHPKYKAENIENRPSLTTLLAGHCKQEGRKKFKVDTIFDRDVAVHMRDGVKIFADTFRPATRNEEKVPAIICWGPYGKLWSGLDNVSYRSGVPKDWTSGYETFEGLDPAEWCMRGYAVVNVDARGAQFSEGTYFFWGQQESEDIYDMIDYLATQAWCNGSVGMAGNSYLAKAQVSYAARQAHPALKALAPWEGFSDIYRQLFRRGGIPMNNPFARLYQGGIASNQEVEDIVQMVRTHPFFDEYWADKYDDVRKINVPLYMLGSFANPFHVYGSFDTFRRAGSDRKWLRVHPTFEWYEMYETKSVNDLQRFFDRYCKGTFNGWEDDTPPVRMSLHGCGTLPDIVERPEARFPLQRQRLVTYYLDSVTKTLSTSSERVKGSVSHQSHESKDESRFLLKFNEYTEICGYAKVKLWMSCDQHDDMDVVVQLSKVDKSASFVTSVNFPTSEPECNIINAQTTKIYGPQGFLRASTAITRDGARSSMDGQEIFYQHDKGQKVTPGSIIPLEITLWPMGMVFAPGEGLMLRIAGHVLAPQMANSSGLVEDENMGTHVVHTGADFSSHLTLPIIPRKV